MNSFDLRTASLNEIVFEGRNKAYGAYILRQLYNRHLATALGTAVALSLLLLGTPVLLDRLFPPIIEAAGPVVLPPPVTPIQPPIFESTPPKSVAGGPAAPSKVTVRPPLVPTHVVDKLTEVEPIVKPVEPVVGPLTDESILHGTTTAPGGTGTGTSTGPGGPGSDTAGRASKGPASNAPFITAEVMPQFVGGEAALIRYLQKNLHYPPQALRNSVEGKVFISFVVQADGSIADVQVLKGLGYGTDEEASRVVKGMPAWTPGKQNKLPVAVRYNLPITFRYE